MLGDNISIIVVDIEWTVTNSGKESGYIQVELYDFCETAMQFSRNYPSPLKHPSTKKRGGSRESGQ